MFSALCAFGAWGAFIHMYGSRHREEWTFPTMAGLATISFFYSIPAIRTTVAGKVNFVFSLLTLLWSLFLCMIAGLLVS